MPQTWVSLYTNILNRVQDAGTINFSAADMLYHMKDGLRDVSTIIPYVVRVPFSIESRYGQATVTSAGNLVDTTKGQFTSSDVGKTVYNATSKEWANITSYASTSSVGVSNNIFLVNDSYYMYNKECTNSKQINISDITDYDVANVEYPIGVKHNVISVSSNPDIIEIDMSGAPEDSRAMSSGTQPNTEVPIYFKKRHKVTQLTTLTGAIAATCAAGATTLSLKSLQAAGTIETDQEFTIDGVRGVFLVNTDATIAGNTAAVTIYPPMPHALATSAQAVSFKLSTLSPTIEPLYCQYVSGKLAVSKPMLSYQQVLSATAQIAAATVAIAAVAGRVNAATIQIAAGTTALALVPGVILTAATAISNATNLINAATTYIAAGTTESFKAVAVILTAATALNAGTTQLAAATVHIASGSTYAAAATVQIAAATVEIAKVTGQIGAGTVLITTGTALINTVPIAGGAEEYAALAIADLNNGGGYLNNGQGMLGSANADMNISGNYQTLAARAIQDALGYVSSAQGYLSQATGDENVNAAYLSSALRALDTAGVYVSQGRGYFEQGITNISLNTGHLNSASGQLQAANVSVNEANGNLRILSARLESSNVRTMEAWGQNQINLAIQRLRSIQGVKTSKSYSRS